MYTFQAACPMWSALDNRYGHISEPEAQFLMALDLCETFFQITCTHSNTTHLSQAIDLLTPLLEETSLWFLLVDRHASRVQRLRSQFEDMLGTAPLGQSCCISQSNDCPTLCQPIEHVHLIFSLLSI